MKEGPSWAILKKDIIKTVAGGGQMARTVAIGIQEFGDLI